jgi:hypothetical protein
MRPPSVNIVNERATAAQHREVHRSSDEVGWWKQAGIDLLGFAQKPWRDLSASELPQSEPAGLEGVLLRVVGYFCVTTVSIVGTIKAPVPVRAEDGLDPPYLHGR